MTSSAFPEQALNWQSLQPELTLNQLSTEKVGFWDLQPNAAQALSLFLAHPKRSLFILKTDEAAEYQT